MNPTQEIQGSAKAPFLPLVLALERALRKEQAGAVAPEIRYRQRRGMASPTAPVTSARWIQKPGRGEGAVPTPRVGAEITTTFLGLSGSASPLPSHLAEAAARDDSGNRQAFLDLFHHRLTELFVASMKQHRGCRALALLSEAHLEPSHDGQFHAEETALLPLRIGRQRGPWIAKLGLEALFRHLGIPMAVTISMTPGHPENLSVRDCTVLGTNRSQLGMSAGLGQQRRDPRGCVGVRLEPVPTTWLDACHPGGELHLAVARWVARANGKPMPFQIEVIPEQPKASVVGKGASLALGRGAQLASTRQKHGWNLPSARSRFPDARAAHGLP